MKLECCGKPVRTPFCPYCGEPLDSCGSLLQYLRSELAKTLSVSQRLQKKIENTKDIKYLKYRLQSDETSLKTSFLKQDRIAGWINLINDMSEKYRDAKAI